MPDQTTILSLPLILPSQAQKHVTHNEALRLLDVMVQLAVADRNLTAPPATPSLGDRHIVAAGATGAWAGQVGKIAHYGPTGWEFFLPKAGWLAWVTGEAKMLNFDGASWVDPASGAFPSEIPRLGINTTADNTSRLSVASAITVLTHTGAGHQVTLNKALASDSAMLSFQTGFSARAEIGTLGSDDLTLRLSADGASFSNALTVEAPSGRVSFPQGVSSGGFSLRDATDPTKIAGFALSGIAAGTTHSYALPNLSGELALLSGSQTFSGEKTFSGTLTVSAAAAEIGTASGTASYGLGNGATGSGMTKTVNLGTGGASGSNTVVNIGSAQSGAGGTTVVNTPTVTFANSVTSVGMTAARVGASQLGLGGAVADVTNRLSINSPAVLMNHAGTSMEATINKAATANDAALTFKTGFSARALVGLLASDSLSVKVSADGATYSTALTTDAASGRITLPQPVVLGGQTADPASPPEGAMWLNTGSARLKARLGGVTRLVNLPEAAVLQPVAGEYILTTMGAGGNATGTLAGAAGRIDLFPFIPRRDHGIDQLALNVTTAVASAQGKIVVYSSDDLGRPDLLLLETGVIDLGTAGVRTIAATVTLYQGLTYWLGIRHGSTAAISTWPVTATPDINGGAVVLTTRKVLRRTLTFSTAAPSNWGFLSSEINAAAAPAFWLRQA